MNDPVPVYNGRILIGWMDRSVIDYYNVHVSLGQNAFRVGESMFASRKVYVFDRCCFQWAEFEDVPVVLRSLR